MNETIALVIAVAAVVVGAAVAILKLVAPKTVTKKDDKALEILEKVEDVIDGEK